MSNEQTANGKGYLPAIEAGKHFGYTKDYLLMLIKDGKIVGQKVKHKWYVYMPSATQYFKDAERARGERRKKISEERKKELRQSRHTARKTKIPTALIETLVIVVIGLSLGSVGYLGTANTQPAQTMSGTSFFKNIARSLYSLITPEPEVKMVTVPVESHENDSISAHVGTTTYTSLIVAPEELLTTTTVESIEDSFSDPVSVSIDPENPNTGIITPIFKDGEGDDYRFLLVPVEVGRVTSVGSTGSGAGE